MTALGPVMGDENSLEPILVSEVYPKKITMCDEDGLTAPFSPLYGESIEFIGRTSDGVIALSNYRVFVMLKESFINIPLGVIEAVEYRDIFYMHVFCKDARTFRCAFATNDVCLEWCKRLNRSIRPLLRLIDAFAFSFHAWLADAQRFNQLVDGYYCLAKLDEPQSSVFDREVQRLGFDLKSAWRITHANSEFKVCSSYPREHILPYNVTDKDMENVADFRASRRFPSVIWRDVQSGVVLARSSQPTVGWLGWRNTYDEALLKAIAESCSINSGFSKDDVNSSDTSALINTTGIKFQKSYNEISIGVGNPKDGSTLSNGTHHLNGKVNEELPRKLVIVDARSYAAAVANRAKGGGCECQEYYTNCEIMFMNLANIHTIRKSFLALRAICSMSPDQPGWLISLENTKWLHYISGLLKSAAIVVNTIEKDRKSVLVHCSDGWDRTPQIVALAELMLDPYYRTLEGFRVLIEKEWIEFGHKFADRCGQGLALEDVNERCPVFLQWLDCIHQLVRQFPCAFQFNETYLVKLVQHVYSCLFGDFLCNTEMERVKERVKQKTSSVWLLLSRHNIKFVNLLYHPLGYRVLRPLNNMQSLHFWNEVYLSDTATATLADGGVPSLSATVTNGLPYNNSSNNSSLSSIDTSVDQQGTPLPAKTRSCDDLNKAVLEEDDNLVPITLTQRRLSDPNLAAHATTSPVPCVGNGTADESCCSVSTPDEILERVETSESTGTVEALRVLAVRKFASSETLKAPEDVDSDVPVSSHGVEVEAAECEKTVGKPGVIMNGLSKSVDNHLGEHKINRDVFETSSDTLTGDEGVSAVSGPEHPECSPELTVSAELDVDKTNGYLAPLDALSCQCRHTVVTSLKTVDRCLSTSDLSCSKVVAGCVDSVAVDIKRTLQHQTAIPLCIDTSLAAVKSGAVAPPDTDCPPLSQTPSQSSTSPPTPSGDVKSAVWNMRTSKPSHNLDWDGLTFYVDPVQQRVAQIMSEHEQHIHFLERQLNATRAVLNRCATHVGQSNIDSRDEQASNDSGERGSSSAVSAVASDVSWEQVEERDSKMTLWVPDHVVTHCGGCQQEFWMVRRKHHCRNCGHVFCADCTSYLLPVPQQQLEKPVRVCFRCYNQALSACVIGNDLDDLSTPPTDHLKTALGVSV